MKLKSMTSIIAKSVTVLAACAALNASAGTVAPKAPLPPMEPEPSALFDTVGAELSAAYDSRYYFRGLWFADNIVSTFLDLSIPLVGGAGEDGVGSITWGIGAGYIATVETPFNSPITNTRSNTAFDYSEIDIYTSLSYELGWATLGVQYQYYFYPDTYAGSFGGVPIAAGNPEFGITGNSELGITLGIPLGDASLSLGYFYDLTVGGSYFEAAVDYTFAVNDWLSIVPSAAVGYGIDYYTGNPLVAGAPTSGFTHFLFAVAAPVQLTKTATFTPYVAWNISGDTRENLNATTWEEIFWGASISVAF